MPLPFLSVSEPMLCESADEIPRAQELTYEPKWDGFRCVVFKNAEEVVLSSRTGNPLQRYFPEVVAKLQAALPAEVVLDGELFIPGPRGLDFDALQNRVHPAASRIARLSAETPASFVAFDCLAIGTEDLRTAPLEVRRERLRQLMPNEPQLFATPVTSDPAEAQRWFTEFEGAGLDGIVAKDGQGAYREGERGWFKVKHLRTCDCVVGGYRLSRKQDTLGAVLLGLYDDAGVLHYVGHTSSFKAAQKRELLAKFKPLEGAPSFVGGRTPDGTSRWATEQTAQWVSLDPVTVCEVTFDHLQGDRFRHAATFVRFRTDKSPRDCRYAQLLPPRPFSLEHVVSLAPPRPNP